MLKCVRAAGSGLARRRVEHQRELLDVFRDGTFDDLCQDHPGGSEVGRADRKPGVQVLAKQCGRGILQP